MIKRAWIPGTGAAAGLFKCLYIYLQCRQGILTGGLSARIALHCAQSQLHAVTTTTMTTRTHGPPRSPCSVPCTHDCYCNLEAGSWEIHSYGICKNRGIYKICGFIKGVWYGEKCFNTEGKKC